MNRSDPAPAEAGSRRSLPARFPSYVEALHKRYEGSPITEVAGTTKLGEEALLNAYRMTRTIREFEERLHVEFARTRTLHS